MRRARIVIAPDLVRDMLGLPYGLTIAADVLVEVEGDDAHLAAAA